MRPKTCPAPPSGAVTEREGRAMVGPGAAATGGRAGAGSTLPLQVRSERSGTVRPTPGPGPSDPSPGLRESRWGSSPLGPEVEGLTGK